MTRAIVAVLAIGCATAPPPPALPPLPPAGDLDHLPPPPRPPDIPSHVARYDDVHVRKGGCPGLPAGILVSPASYAMRLYALNDRRRLIVEAQAIRDLRIAERQATLALEEACRARSAELEAAVASQRRLGTVKGVVAFVAGGLAVFLSAVAARKITP